jgi:hypothetical protein
MMHSLTGVIPFAAAQPESLVRSLVSSWWFGVAATIHRVTTSSWLHLPATTGGEGQHTPSPRPRAIAPGLIRLDSDGARTWTMPWPVPPE